MKGKGKEDRGTKCPVVPSRAHGLLAASVPVFQYSSIPVFRPSVPPPDAILRTVGESGRQNLIWLSITLRDKFVSMHVQVLVPIETACTSF